MGRRNFFDRLVRTLDFQKEYQKIESLVLQPHSLHGYSIENSIERYFKDWKYNANYLSFKELRDQLKFYICTKWLLRYANRTYKRCK